MLAESHSLPASTATNAAADQTCLWLPISDFPSFTFEHVCGGEGGEGSMTAAGPHAWVYIRGLCGFPVCFRVTVCVMHATSTCDAHVHAMGLPMAVTWSEDEMKAGAGSMA